MSAALYWDLGKLNKAFLHFLPNILEIFDDFVCVLCTTSITGKTRTFFQKINKTEKTNTAHKPPTSQVVGR